jgi:LacI family transcriptional regulator
MAAVPSHWSGDGIISLILCDETRRAVDKTRAPFIDMGLMFEEENWHRVVVDNRQDGEAAADYLWERGLRSYIVQEVGPGNRMFRERYLSFRNRVEELSPDLEIHLLPDQGYDVDTRAALRDAPKPCGFFGYNDSQALTALDQALVQGFRVPDDIAILGSDNNELACESVEIPLSSVDTDHEGLGEEAALLLARILNGEKVEPRIHRHRVRGVVARRSTDILTSSNPRVIEALEYIQEYLHTGLNTQTLAADLGMTPQNLHGLFRRHYGRTPGQAIRVARLNMAKHLLRTTNDPLDSIADKAGFGSSHSLCRSFRRDLGTTPTRWRRQNTWTPPTSD